MSNIKKSTTFGKLQISEFKVSQYQKPGTKTVTLKQEVVTKTTYPSIQLNDGLNASIIPDAAFGTIPDGKSFESKETRTCFLNVPADFTLEQMQAAIAAGEVKAQANGSQLRIIKRMSNNPQTLLSDGQKSAMVNGLKKLDDFAASMVSRYGKNHAQSGQLILDKDGNPQYRDMVLSDNNVVTDSNTCGNGDIYISAALKAEMNGVMNTVDANSILFQEQMQVETLKF